MTKEQAAALTDRSRAVASHNADAMLCKFCKARPTIGKTVHIVHAPDCPSYGAQRQRRLAAS